MPLVDLDRFRLADEMGSRIATPTELYVPGVSRAIGQLEAGFIGQLDKYQNISSLVFVFAFASVSGGSIRT